MRFVVYITSDATVNIAAAINPIRRYIGAFASGGVAPFWTHLILLGGAILAEISVAVGILLESPQEKTLRERIGMGLVLGGVAVSAIFTIGLFVFDEGISNAQQSDISVVTAQLKGAQTNIAKTEKAAADEKLRAAEIMRATAWRGFTAQQQTILKTDLSAHSGKILLGWILDDPESLSLAIQFDKLLEAANQQWNVEFDAQSFPNTLVWGVWIPNSPQAQDTAQLLRKSFADAGIKVTKEDLPKSTGLSWRTLDNKLKSNRALIFFGSKRPTFMQPP